MLNITQRNEFLECLQSIANFSHASLQAIAARQSQSQQQQHQHNVDEHHHEHEGEEGLLIAKITAVFVLFLASSFCGSLPFLVQFFFNWPNKKQQQQQQNIDAQSSSIVKCLLYFGGGVLLCTTFVHLLPEVQETVEQLTECQLLPEFKFPLAQLLMCIGFFLMYLVEETIHTYIHYQQNATATTTLERGYSIRRSVLMKQNGSNNGDKGSVSIESMVNTTTTTATTMSNIDDVEAVKTISTRDLITCEAEQPHNFSHHSHHHSHNHSHDHKLANGSSKKQEDFNASLRGLFIVLALSIHELFEGMAIGLEHSTSAVWVMFGAVSAHKLVLAFCVGVELIVARTRLLLSIIYIFTFAIVSPIGIGIGILVSSNETSSSNIASVFLQGLACGTLLYVVFFEILSKNYAGLKAVAAMICGFAIMFGLQMLGEDSHSHSHGGSCMPTAVEASTTLTPVLTSHNFNEQLQMLSQASSNLLKQQ